jgi:hypothetical protein
VEIGRRGGYHPQYSRRNSVRQARRTFVPIALGPYQIDAMRPFSDFDSPGNKAMRLMRSLIGAVVAVVLVLGPGRSVRADDAKDAQAVIDKAVKALGGAEKLGAVKAATWSAKGKLSFDGNDNEFTSKSTVQGLDHFRQEFEGEFGGDKIKGVSVLAGDKGWRKFGEDSNELDKETLANEKRIVYLQVVSALVLPLKDQGFKIESLTEEKVGDKPAVAVKITGPDGKDFQLFFDKDGGLPVKQIAKVADFRGEEYTQETLYGEYKDFDGIKKATKIEMKRNGEKFIVQEISDFKVVEKVEPKTFSEP